MIFGIMFLGFYCDIGVSMFVWGSMLKLYIGDFYYNEGEVVELILDL